MTPAPEHANRGTIVIEWAHARDESDPDLRWAWNIKADPPLRDSDLAALLAAIAQRV